MKISIIIPNYNGEKILSTNLPKVLRAVEQNESENLEIIISDDFSSDNSIQIIQDFIAKNNESKVKLKLITATENKGFSSNVNRGVSHSVGEILILLNTDVIPRDDFLFPLLKHFEDKNVFAVGCMDESIENGKLILRGRGVGKWQKGFLVHSAGNLKFNDTLWVSGGSGAFRKEVWEKLGGLDELFNPFYWEDIDLSYRALKSGYKIVFEKESIVRHEHHEGVIKKQYSTKKVRKIVYRNQIIFAWKNSDIKNLSLNFIWMPYHLSKAILGKDLSLIYGFFSAIKLITKIIKSRKNAGILFIKSDNEIIASIVD